MDPWVIVLTWYGSQARAAGVAGCAQTAISKRVVDRAVIPAEWARRFFDHSSGQIALHEMRPDLWGRGYQTPRSPEERRRVLEKLARDHGRDQATDSDPSEAAA